jgi:Coenzyme F420 hydrogenase/dehydrogenase, beta subunit C terminus.
MDNPFFRGFLRDVYLRKSCCDCQFRSYHRNTDITLGDYWGVEKLCPDLFDDKGTSIVFTHTSKGRLVLTEIADDLLLIEQEKENAVLYNPSMDRMNPVGSKRRRFFCVFRHTSFKKAEFVIDKDSLGKRILRKLKQNLLS